MNLKTNYQIGGSTVNFAALEWSVYENYEIINVVTYIEKQNKQAQQRLLNIEPNFYELVHEHLADVFVIVPNYQDPSSTYNPLNYKAAIMLALMKSCQTSGYLSVDDFSDEQIIAWAREFGLPFNIPYYPHYNFGGMENELNDTDTLIGVPYRFERILYQAFDHYVMFRQSFQALMREAINLVKGYTAFSNNQYDEMIEAFSVLASSEDTAPMWDRLNGVAADFPVAELNNYIRETLASLLSRHISGYLNFVSPVMLQTSSRANSSNIIFTPTWKVPNLWTALIVQLYESMIRNQPFKKCEYCGTEFEATDPRMRYCPRTQSVNGNVIVVKNERSYCQNMAKVKSFREKKRMASAASTTSN